MEKKAKKTGLVKIPAWKLSRMTFIALFACLLLASQFSCTEKDVDTPLNPPVNPPEDSTNVSLLAEGGSSPAWSPDGKEIAYIYEESLYLMNSDGSNKRELATDIMEAPIWSPSGDYILYTGHSPSTLWVLVRLDANGDNRTILCGGSTEPHLASWSPDGQKIAFTTWNGTLCAMNTDGTNLHTVTTNVCTYETPRWSPDMNRLLFTWGFDYDRDMYFINSDGSNLICLPIDSTSETHVQFSIDGTKVFFRGSYMWGTDIFSVNCDGSGIINLTGGQGSNSYPQLSPDGTKVAFTSNQTGEDAALYIMATDGSGKQQLTEKEDLDFGISWSPDGKEIAFCMRKDYKLGIYSIRMPQ